MNEYTQEELLLIEFIETVKNCLINVFGWKSTENRIPYRSTETDFKQFLGVFPARGLDKIEFFSRKGRYRIGVVQFSAQDSPLLVAQKIDSF